MIILLFKHVPPLANARYQFIPVWSMVVICRYGYEDET